jgi:hypothetical protein
MLMKMKKEYKKEYVLVGCGGMNSESRWLEGKFDDLNEVFEYCSREEIVDDSGVRFRNSFKEEYWEDIEKVYGKEIEDIWDDCDRENGIIGRDDKISKVYLINEGVELMEVDVDVLV